VGEWERENLKGSGFTEGEKKEEKKREKKKKKRKYIHKEKEERVCFSFTASLLQLQCTTPWTDKYVASTLTLIPAVKSEVTPTCHFSKELKMYTLRKLSHHFLSNIPVKLKHSPQIN
jgi:hypothetical protein